MEPVDELDRRLDAALKREHNQRVRELTRPGERAARFEAALKAGDQHRLAPLELDVPTQAPANITPLPRRSWMPMVVGFAAIVLLLITLMFVQNRDSAFDVHAMVGKISETNLTPKPRQFNITLTPNSNLGPDGLLSYKSGVLRTWGQERFLLNAQFETPLGPGANFYLGRDERTIWVFFSRLGILVKSAELAKLERILPTPQFRYMELQPMLDNLKTKFQVDYLGTGGVKPHEPSSLELHHLRFHLPLVNGMAPQEAIDIYATPEGEIQMLIRTTTLADGRVLTIQMDRTAPDFSDTTVFNSGKYTSDSTRQVEVDQAIKRLENRRP